MDYTVHGILQARILEWVAFSFSRGSSQPRDRTRSATLHVDSLPTKPQGKPKNSLSLLQRIFLTQELNQGLLHCRQILYQLNYEGNTVVWALAYCICLAWHQSQMMTICLFSPSTAQGDLVGTHYIHLLDLQGMLNSGLRFERETTLISLTINFFFFFFLRNWKNYTAWGSQTVVGTLWYTYNLTFSKREKHFTIGPTFSEWNHSKRFWKQLRFTS